MNQTIEFTDRLKAATQQEHQTIEQAHWMKQLMHPSLTKEEYTGILKKWYPVIAAFEKQLYRQQDELATIFPDWESRLKLAMLQKDISMLNETVPETDESTPSAINELVGAFYVLEGSSLGGRVILKQLATLDWFDASFGNFFAGYGAQTGSQWVKFRDYLIGYVAGAEENAGEIIAAAQHKFVELYQHFN